MDNVPVDDARDKGQRIAELYSRQLDDVLARLSSADIAAIEDSFPMLVEEIREMTATEPKEGDPAVRLSFAEWGMR